MGEGEALVPVEGRTRRVARPAAMATKRAQHTWLRRGGWGAVRLGQQKGRSIPGYGEFALGLVNKRSFHYGPFPWGNVRTNLLCHSSLSALRLRRFPPRIRRIPLRALVI